MALTLAVAGHYAIARTAQPFPNISVDVSPLRANSLNPTAAWVAEELPGQIAEALARRRLSELVQALADWIAQDAVAH